MRFSATSKSSSTPVSIACSRACAQSSGPQADLSSKPLLERNVRDVLDEATQRRRDRLKLTRPSAPRMPSIGSTLESGEQPQPPPPP